MFAPFCGKYVKNHIDENTSRKIKIPVIETAVKPKTLKKIAVDLKIAEQIKNAAPKHRGRKDKK